MTITDLIQVLGLPLTLAQKFLVLVTADLFPLDWMVSESV